MNGKGFKSKANGDAYAGNWIDGKQSGHGCKISVYGTKFVGDWQDDRYHG